MNDSEDRSCSVNSPDSVTTEWNTFRPDMVSHGSSFDWEDGSLTLTESVSSNMSTFKKQPAQPSQRKKLSNVTWVRGAKPCKTLRTNITWCEGNKTGFVPAKGKKSGGPGV